MFFSQSPQSGQSGGYYLNHGFQAQAMMAAQTQQYPIQQQQPVQQVQSPNGQIKQAAQQQQGAPSPSESRKFKFN